MKKLLTGRLANIATNQEENLWDDFRNCYRKRKINRNEALSEAIDLWYESNKDFKTVSSNIKLIKSTSMVIMWRWKRFKDLFKKRGLKKDPAITEAIQLYIKKYGEK